MKIDASVDWYVGRIVGAEVLRVNDVSVDSDVGGEVGSGDWEGFQLKF